MNQLNLSVTQEIISDGTRRVLHLDTNKQKWTFYFDLINCYNVPEPEVLDGFVYGIIFLAMELGVPLKIHGALSRSAIFNIAKFQSVWTCWIPGKYKAVNIIPDAIKDRVTKSKPDCAISAFSGGVDSTFTAIRHVHKHLGIASYPLKDVLLVHGFDVPLNKKESFCKLYARVKPLIEELGLGFKVIRTNLKEDSGQNWGHSFGAQLAACLHNFSHNYRYALVASDEPYQGFSLPWGSNPITNHLLSGDSIQFILDGASHSRIEKLIEIAKFATALHSIKVCWEGPDPEKNCGRCEKCLRTKLCFSAIGIDNPPCFEDPLNIEDIYEIKPKNKAQVNALKRIHAFLNNLNNPNKHQIEIKSALSHILSIQQAKQIVSEFEQLDRISEDIKKVSHEFQPKKNSLFKILASLDTPWLIRESAKEFIKYILNLK